MLRRRSQIAAYRHGPKIRSPDVFNHVWRSLALTVISWAAAVIRSELPASHVAEAARTVASRSDESVVPSSISLTRCEFAVACSAVPTTSVLVAEELGDAAFDVASLAHPEWPASAVVSFFLESRAMFR
jgi:hypothetical protein